MLPAFELISTIAQRKPGPDGTYSTYIAGVDVARYLAAARRIHALVVLDVQPGRADFLTKARHFEKFLDEDTRMFTPAEAMAFRPRPELITYQ